ncbi:hypothetical protein Tco_1294324 [Tanacetum coccineum]
MKRMIKDRTDISSSLTSSVLASGSDVIKPVIAKKTRDMRIDFGDDLRHIDESSQVECDVGNFMVQRTLCSTKLEDFSQRNKIFKTKCLIDDNAVGVGFSIDNVIDGGICENLVSRELANTLKLLTKQHSNPYKLGWIKKGLEVKVSEVCKIPIAIGSSYRDVVSCDVVDLGASLVLIGRSWKHDVDAIHRGKKNFYVLSWYGKNIVILPNGRPLDLNTLFIRPLIGDSENPKASSFQVRENDEKQDSRSRKVEVVTSTT